MREKKRSARSGGTRGQARSRARRPALTVLQRMVVPVAVWLGIVVLCACDTSSRGPDRSPCEAYLASLARCSGPRIAERTRASLDAALAKSLNADATIAACGAQRERLPSSCR